MCIHTEKHSGKTYMKGTDNRTFTTSRNQPWLPLALLLLVFGLLGAPGRLVAQTQQLTRLAQDAAANDDDAMATHNTAT